MEMSDSMEVSAIDTDDNFSSDMPFPSYSCAMPYATQRNTSPISAFLRTLDMTDNEQCGDFNDSSVDMHGRYNNTARSQTLNIRAMLRPLDEWMSLPQENQGSLILRKSMLVTSPGLIVVKDDDEDQLALSGSSVKELLGGIGRDNLSGHELEDLNAFDIYTTSAQTTRAAEKPNGSSATSCSYPMELPIGKPTAEVTAILRCFVHERVVRDLKSKSQPLSFIRDIVKDKIIGGALVREKQQYQKAVTKDVLELRIDEKIRVLYARSKNAVLIIEIVWNHKLDKPIKRAQQEISVMQTWMAGSGYAEEEPFVMVDWLSGRLRPLYVIDILYDAESGEIHEGDCVFNPTMLDLVLSPQQKQACDHTMTATNEYNGYEREDSDWAEGELTSTSTQMSRPTLNIVVFQGSAGNGKTTCLLRSGLSRAKREEKVIFVAATQIFADSVEQDLRGSITKDFRIIVRDKFTELIRSTFAPDLAGEEHSSSEASLSEVISWLDEIEAKKGKKMDKGAIRALSEWLMKGHRETADTVSYSDFVRAYDVWKKLKKKRDEGDMWKFVLKKLIEENELEGEGEGEGNTIASCRLQDLDRECDILVIDEAQLYPALTYFQALLLWYRPRKTLLLGMDTKQAVYLGCSNRRALMGAVHSSGWHQRNVQSYSLTTNFRLPARLVALSNAMVGTLKVFFPKVFDEYNKDDGFESRSATSKGDTLAAAEAMEAPVRAIERFPAMLVVGAAAVALRTEICRRMDVNRRSVLSMRFAHISSESAPANYTTTGQKVGGYTLADLPTIKFQAVSGLEISLPVIVDSLLTSYIEELCPRKIFSSVKRGVIVEDHEMNMLRTALCTVYTVLTRCRGPLIWLEDSLNSDLEKSHPLVRTLREALSKGTMDIDFVTDPKKIDKKFVDRLFNVTDVEELNVAYEDSTCQILQKFKSSFWAAVELLRRLLKEGGSAKGNLPSEFKLSEEYSVLLADKVVLLAQLSMSAHDGADRCCSFLDKICDTLFLKAGCGDWAVEWGQDLEDMMMAVEMFPKTSRCALQKTTGAIAPGPSLVRGGIPGVYPIEVQLQREALRLCTCGEGPRQEDLRFVLAFHGENLGSRGEMLDTEGSTVWVIHQVLGKSRQEDSSLIVEGEASAAISMGAYAAEKCYPCITEKTYVLSCYSDNSVDREALVSHRSRMCMMMFKFEGNAELTITRASDGWLTLQERAFWSGCGVSGLTHSVAVNAGMKCRCRAKGVGLAGAAKRHSYGPFVVEIDGILMGSSAAGKRLKASLASDVLRMPPVGDERMISLLEGLFQGKDLSFQSSSSSESESESTVEWESLPLSGLVTPHTSSNKYRTAASFAWNNLLGGKLLFVGVEARLQPWALLLPTVTSSLGCGEVAALALLDQMRRAVEACLTRDQAVLDQSRVRYGDESKPLVISRKRVLEIDGAYH